MFFGEELFVEIYPREGTETISRFVCAVNFWLKFIPVRGRKLRNCNTIDRLDRVEIYPREGTETFSDEINITVNTLKFIPVRGRKLPTTLF